MRRLMSRVMTIVLLVVGLAIGSTALADQFIISKEGNIRNGPGTNYPVIGHTTIDQKWKVIETQDNWVKVGDNQYIYQTLGIYFIEENTIVPEEVATKKEVVNTSLPYKEKVTEEVETNTSLSTSIPNDFILIGISSIIFILLIIFIIGNIKKRSQLKQFKPISDILKEEEKLSSEVSNIKEQINKLKEEYALKKNNLQLNYSTANTKYKELKSKILIFEDDLEMMDMGFYKPHFEFDTSEAYKTQVNLNKNKQKQLVQQKKACMCDEEWSVGGSRQEGRKMTNRTISLAIKAFNGECNVAISNTRWNNYESMKNRISRSFEYINKMNEPNRTYLTDAYLAYKYKELDLSYKYEEKKKEEKEEQRILNEQIREEKKIEVEIKRAELEARKKEASAIKDAKIAQEAYNKAKKDVEAAGDEEKEVLMEQLRVSGKRLQEAKNLIHSTHDESTRISSMAEHTKAGRVYILSNIGSFGPDICKIGMTRALEPMDRVKNLSGASVPFEFDCHAMIATKNAPGLENDLHKYFSSRRVNLSNMRKEYFFVSLDEIEKWLKDNDYKAEIIKIREARTYRETQSMRKAGKKSIKEPDTEFDGDLFSEDK